MNNAECGAVGSVLGLGPSGRRFESCHSECIDSKFLYISGSI